MKVSKKSLQSQRALIESKVASWLPVRNNQVPPTGWLRAMRDALGLTSRQLAARLGVEHASILQFEKKEAEGKVSFESIIKVSEAMNCRFIYAVVPKEPFHSIEGIVKQQSLLTACEPGLRGQKNVRTPIKKRVTD